MMARAVLLDETFYEVGKKVGAVGQIQPECVVSCTLRRIEQMLKIRLTLPTRRPAGWGELITLIHAMVKGEEGINMPLCVWNHMDEKAAARVKAEVAISKDVGG